MAHDGKSPFDNRKSPFCRFVFSACPYDKAWDMPKDVEFFLREYGLGARSSSVYIEARKVTPEQREEFPGAPARSGPPIRHDIFVYPSSGSFSSTGTSEPAWHAEELAGLERLCKILFPPGYYPKSKPAKSAIYQETNRIYPRVMTAEAKVCLHCQGKERDTRILEFGHQYHNGLTVCATCWPTVAEQFHKILLDLTR
jgi:hypothetical protein